MKTSIILPSYVIDETVHGYLKQCLANLEANTDRESYQLVIVDNGSVAGSELMKSKADIYVRKEQPMGYARAANLGLSLADGDYLCILNNDLFVPKDWLPNMIKDYESIPNAGTIAPMEGMPEKRLYHDSHWFSLVLFSRKVFTEIGYLDESINYRFHDQDYSIRVKKAGYEVLRTGNVAVEHINSATYGKMKRNEDPVERDVMIKRYGHAHFEEWLRNNK